MSAPDAELFPKPRIAPNPEHYEAEPDLDVVIVLPCYNEGLNVLRTLSSIAKQEKRKRGRVLYSAVVVINNRPDSPPEAISKNMQAYTVLQMLKFGHAVDVGDAELNQCIQDIQEENLRIDVIDAFSPEHAHPKSNVGRARHIGKQYAQNLPLYAPHILGTDGGDTVLTPRVVNAAYDALEAGQADAFTIPSRLNIERLDPESKYAYQRWSLGWRVQNAFLAMERSNRHAYDEGPLRVGVPGAPIIEQALTFMGGAGTAVSKKFARLVDYNPELGTAEDTDLQFKIADAGGTVRDLTEIYPNAVVLTEPRISLRTEAGFGHTINKYAGGNGPFGSVEIRSPEALIKSRAFLSAVGILPDNEKAAHEFERLCRRFAMPEETVRELSELYDRWRGSKANTREHHDIVEKANKFFDRVHPPVEINQLIVALEKQNQRLAENLDERLGFVLKDLPGGPRMLWRVFQASAFRSFEACMKGGQKEVGDNSFQTYRALVASEFRPFVSKLLAILRITEQAVLEKKKVEKGDDLDAYDEEEPKDREWGRRGKNHPLLKVSKEGKDAIKNLTEVFLTSASSEVLTQFLEIERKNLTELEQATFELLAKVEDSAVSEAWKNFAEYAGWDIEALQQGKRVRKKKEV